jgi:subfamily B ATP-binding cassette protein MsbA
LATLTIAVNQGLSAAKRILPVIDHQSEILENENDTNLKLVDANIKFKDVTFRYDQEENEVLRSINLEAVGKKMTALVGHSGSGKSTIMSLIPRLYNIQSGDILIDDQSIYKTKIFSLRESVSLVSQDTTLFDDTVKNNIAYGNLGASDAEIVEAAKLSFSEDFINKLPRKYDTVIGENGVRLSGGEKQRISIARALINEPQIILADEPTGSLDFETAKGIFDILKKQINSNRLIIFATHNRFFANKSDCLLEMVNGNIKTINA